jgi:hypothetical protein
MGDGRRSLQMTTRMSEKLRDDAVAIAKLKGERDRMGSGASVVVRRALERYVAQNRHLLSPDHDASSSS